MGRTAVMGILNVTPDSFYDGGATSSSTPRSRDARELLREGADLIDVGGESSRPGAHPISADEECARVVPVVAALRHATDGADLGRHHQGRGRAPRPSPPAPTS